MNAAAADADGLCRAAAALGIALAAGDAAALLEYLDAMLAVNRRVNLTAIRDREAATVLHALDGLAVGLPELGVSPPRRVLDLGSGNGFPGVAVAALWPDAAVTLCERRGRKVRAMAEALQACGRGDRFELAHVDAEQAPALRPPWRHAFDLVCARAVSADAARLAAMAAPLLARQGALALWQDDAGTPEPTLGHGMRNAAVARYRLPEPAVRDRRIALYRRISS